IEIPLIGVVTGAAAGVMMSDITTFFRDGHERKVVDLFGRAAKKSSLILYPIMIAFFVLADDVMVTIYSDEYLESSVPFRIYLFLLPFRVVLYGAVLQGAGRSRLILVSSAMALVVNVILSVILVRKLGYSGAAIGTVVTVGGFLVPFLLVQIARTTRVSVWKVLPYFDLLKRFMASALCGVIPFLLLRYAGEGWYSQVRLVVGGAAYGLSLAVVFQVFGFMDIRNWSQYLVRKKSGSGAD
ncbi:MAG: polysaccharide biosynthesis C-terminal domain-containing protein, partial [Verrucomicrobiales bacterium]|nr:polysaccharide biosynthesis C-terminal domain-containing protein [Verrucomicrobiales bacterium]